MNPTPQGQLPKLSVLMLTYNHERFIAHSIESVLMQSTNFPIELVIGEDCSTDGTRRIVNHYAAHRPDVIRPLLRSTNIGAHANFVDVLNCCRGNYIAMLEGDDSWNCAHKLQRQVDFLDQNPTYSISGHRVTHVFVDHPENSPYPSPSRKEFGTLDDILDWNYLPTCSVVFRAAHLQGRSESIADPALNDWVLWSLLAEGGPIGFINEIMADYRVHRGGVWMGASQDERLRMVEKTINTIHKRLGSSHAAARRRALFTMHLTGASEFDRQANFGKLRRQLLLAMARNPLAFVKSSEARSLVKSQYYLYLVTNGVEPVKTKYQEARIWAGAHRRRVWKAITGRLSL